MMILDANAFGGIMFSRQTRMPEYVIEVVPEEDFDIEESAENVERLYREYAAKRIRHGVIRNVEAK